MCIIEFSVENHEKQTFIMLLFREKNSAKVSLFSTYQNLFDCYSRVLHRNFQEKPDVIF